MAAEAALVAEELGAAKSYLPTYSAFHKSARGALCTFAVVIRTECAEAKQMDSDFITGKKVVIRTECAETKCNPTPRRRLGLGCDPHAVR